MIQLHSCDDPMIDGPSAFDYTPWTITNSESAVAWRSAFGSPRSLSDKACDESDEISPVVECFVIDWTAACRVGSSFNAKNRAP
jgi:hypothetical protein